VTGVPRPTASDLQIALHRSEGTVTEFLEHLAGEPVDADVLSQDAGPAGHDNSLGLEPDAELIRRSVLLTGRTSGRRFVYAESTIAMERLPGDARLRLESTREPIGRVLARNGLAISRQPLPGNPIPVRATGGIVDLLDGAALCRRYRISVGREAAIVISEWFLQTVPDALASL
jgi:chorismate-pyruvate lyase